MKRDYKTPREKIKAKALKGASKGIWYSERPRLCVYRSLKHIYAQIIDDVAGKTLVAASSLDFEGTGSSVEGAKKVGEMIGKKAVEAGITKVVYDRGGNIYHGRIKALAEGAREAGLDL